MNWEQFKAAEREVKLTSGSKSLTMAKVTRRNLTQVTKRTDERKIWMKSATPYRISLKPSSYKTPSAKTGTMTPKEQVQSTEGPTNEAAANSSKKSENKSGQRRDKGEGKSYVDKPLPTIYVQWQLKRTFAPYNLTELKYVMSGFGKVQGVQQIEPNSALVVFQDLRSAQRAVNSTTLGRPFCRITSHWLFPVLAQPNVFASLRDQPQIPQRPHHHHHS